MSEDAIREARAATTRGAHGLLAHSPSRKLTLT